MQAEKYGFVKWLFCHRPHIRNRSGIAIEMPYAGSPRYKHLVNGLRATGECHAEYSSRPNGCSRQTPLPIMIPVDVRTGWKNFAYYHTEQGFAGYCF